MNASSSQKIKIGIFVIVGILILIAGIFLIGSKKNMFSTTFSIYGTFKNAGGLQLGNNVRFGGVNIGTVKTIRIIEDTVVRVDMIIKSEMSDFIKSDAFATIGSDGLMGDKVLMIEPGTATAPVLKPGSKIRTVEPVDFGTIIAKFSLVADNAEVITGALANMALEIKNGNGSISRLLYTNDLVTSLEGTANNAKNITSSLNGIADHIQSGQGSLGSLIYTDSLSNKLEKTVSTATYALSTVQVAADNFGENMKALQGNYFFKGYFKKKAKALADSTAAGDNEEEDLNDAELEHIKADAEKELQRRRSKAAAVSGKGKDSDKIK